MSIIPLRKVFRVDDRHISVLFGSDWCNAMLPNKNNLQNILAKKVLGSFFCFTTMKPARI